MWFVKCLGQGFLIKEVQSYFYSRSQPYKMAQMIWSRMEEPVVDKQRGFGLVHR
jgi:hypothetical protein